MSFSGFFACKISNNNIKINFFGNASFNTQSCQVGRWIFKRKNKFTLDIWATQFQLSLKSMWTIERLSQHLPVLTCEVLYEFVLVN
jgi:hypothetical protein